jgi:hypothetical protein
MGHCGGGEGPNAFDKIGTLDQWVTQGKTPERIIASTAREERSTAHARCVPIRRSPGAAPAVSTTQPASVLP